MNDEPPPDLPDKVTRIPEAPRDRGLEYDGEAAIEAQNEVEWFGPTAEEEIEEEQRELSRQRVPFTGQFEAHQPGDFADDEDNPGEPED